MKKNSMQPIIYSMVAIIIFILSNCSPVHADALKQKISKMSLSDKIAQMYFAPSSGNSDEMKQAIQKYHLGGVVLFGIDFQNQTTSQFKDKLASWQQASSIPLFIGTDQEGGTVSRLSDNPALTNNRSFPSPQSLNYDLQAEANEAQNVAKILHDLGINWNFTPVADVSTDQNSFIYPRTFGKGYEQTASYIEKVVPAIQSQNVVATLKHFPGYGTSGDTHTGFASTDKSLDQFNQQDFLPFIAGIKSHVDSILVSHIVINQVDNHYPASLSPKINQIIRKQLHFKGVIVTDDLGMGAITKFANEEHANADVLAVKAGNDLLLSKNYQDGIPAIEQAVKNHEISEKQINQSVYRILKLKEKIKILNVK